MRLFTKLSMLIPLLSCGTEVFAEDDFSFAIMPVAYTQQSIYDGGKNNSGFFPVPELRWEDMFIANGKIGINLVKYQGLSIDLSVGGDYMGDTDRGDSKKLKDMKELDNVFTANIDLNYESDLGKLSFGYAQDISNKHKGHSLTAGYSYNIEFGRFFVEPSVSVTYASDDVANYYYGVSKADVTADRAFYRVDSTVNYEAGLMAGYVIDKNSMIIGFASITKYDKEIKDSPIVVDDTAMTYGLGYRHQF
ncbi:MAG: outer membrane protein [Alteromonadaceae bacterium]|jgi:outer membrane protein